MNRRLTHSVVAQTTHIGAAAAMSGSAAICAEPAYTRTDMKMASGTPMPLLAMATPATTPHAAIPIAIGMASPAPSRTKGRRAKTRAFAPSDSRQDFRDMLPPSVGDCLASFGVDRLKQPFRFTGHLFKTRSFLSVAQVLEGRLLAGRRPAG